MSNSVPDHDVYTEKTQFVIQRGNRIFITIGKKSLKVASIMTSDPRFYSYLEHVSGVTMFGEHRKCMKKVIYADGLFICEKCNEVVEI